MENTFEIMSINYNHEDIYTQDKVLVNNYDDLISIYTENGAKIYKKEMSLFVYDDDDVYITAGDIEVGEYLAKVEFKDIENLNDVITCTAVRTFRESFDPSNEGYNKTHQDEAIFTIVNIDDTWLVDDFSYNK